LERPFYGSPLRLLFRFLLLRDPLSPHHFGAALPEILLLSLPPCLRKRAPFKLDKRLFALLDIDLQRKANQYDTLLFTPSG
jgi:hypothetical protein